MSKEYEVLLEWQAPEYKHYPKNAAWYITLSIAWVAFVVYMILQKDWFGAVSLGLVGIFFIAYARREPELINVQLSDQGVHLEDQHIPYTKIRHFWIIDNERHKVLNFHTTAYINNEFNILLEDQDADLVHELLSTVLDEHPEPEETLAQRIMHRIKF